jgi:hypothetical protein
MNDSGSRFRNLIKTLSIKNTIHYENIFLIISPVL